MVIGSGYTSFKNGKMNTAIFTQFLELRMVGKGVFLTMFQYEPAIFYKNFRIQHKFRKWGNDFEVIWRICKNQVVWGPALHEVFAYIPPDDPDIFYPELPGCTLEKWSGPGIDLNHIHPCCPPWRKFQSDASGTRKQVQDHEIIEIVGIGKHIEQSLPGKICGWPGSEGTGYGDVPSLVCATDYTQW